MRGNATLLALVVMAAMTTTSLQVWRLWSMHAAVLHEREAWYEEWFTGNACFDAVVWLLQASYDQTLQQAKLEHVCVLSVPEVLQKIGVVSVAIQYTKADLLLVTVTMWCQKSNKKMIRFLVEKQPHVQSAEQSHLVIHHVTFGTVV